MADSSVSTLYNSNPATGKANLRLYAVDPDESTTANRSKALTFEILMNSIVTKHGEVIVKDGNIVIGA